MSVTSADGLRLHGAFFPCEGSKRVMVCFHEYTSERLSNFSSITRFCLKRGSNLMVAGERTHGKSEGTYIGLGCLDHHDALGWIRYVVSRLGQDYGLMFHGISTRGATILMTAGLTLPPQVKAAASDCALTFVWKVFSHVLRSMYHMSVFSAMQITDRMTREEAGYSLDERNARDEVKRAKIPILFIHGDKDILVSCFMIYNPYNACRSPRPLLVALGASHAEVYYKDTEGCGNAVNQLIHRHLDH